MVGKAARLHPPVGGGGGVQLRPPFGDWINRSLSSHCTMLALWKGLQMAKAQGLVRSIGVSNYFPGELAALEGEKPAINQCEMSVQGYDNATIAYCQANGIVYQSYGAMRGCPFSDPEVAAIAKTHSVSTAQVRRALQIVGAYAPSSLFQN